MAPLIANDHFASACTREVVQSTSGRNAVAREYASQQWTKIVLILIRQQDRRTDPIDLLPRKEQPSTPDCLKIYAAQQ